MHDGPVIANNTPLVALWVLGRLDILHALYAQVLVPPAVCDEFLATERALRQSALDNAPWLKMTPLIHPQHVRVYIGLDQGESEVLALAEERSARLILMDELRGRRYARRLDIPLTGTLGVLLLAKERSLIDHVAPCLTDLQDAGLYLHPSLVAQTLTLAGELS